MELPPSAWPTRYKVLAIVLFVAVMATWYVVWSGFIHSLPVWIVGYIFVGGMAFALGWLAGERSAAREFEKRRDRDALP